jgi:glutathione synthase/RimK-type ligase-like ATP-grasp enzyme
MKKRIAFVTSSVKPDFASNDLYAVNSLRSSGTEVFPLPWDVETTAWDSFDLVIIRSCWNYHLHPEKFLKWIDSMEKRKVKMLNPLKIARWNLHKGYLKELQLKGIAIPETIWLDKGSAANLSLLMNEKNWSRAVVKPAISATAFNTFLVSNEDAREQQKKFEEILAHADMLVQKFMPEVLSHGEWSIIFFDKKFSHAVIKQPAAKDFRVQNDFGGIATPARPPEFAIEQAKKIISLIEEPLLYARVDGVISENKFLLMELELIEPVLFLEQENGSAKTFANAMMDFINYN